MLLRTTSLAITYVRQWCAQTVRFNYYWWCSVCNWCRSSKWTTKRVNVARRQTVCRVITSQQLSLATWVPQSHRCTLSDRTFTAWIVRIITHVALIITSPVSFHRHRSLTLSSSAAFLSFSVVYLEPFTFWSSLSPFELPQNRLLQKQKKSQCWNN